MMKKIVGTVVLLLLAVVMMGCSPERTMEKVSFKGIENVEVDGTTRVRLSVGVENRNPYSVALSDVNAELRMGGKAVCRVIQAADAVAAGDSDGIVTVDFKVECDNPLVMLLVMRKINSGQSDDLIVRMGGNVRFGWVKRRFDNQIMPFAQVLQMVENKNIKR